MLKKLIVLTLAVMLIMGSFSTVYGDSYARKQKIRANTGGFELIGKENSKTFEKEQVIYGKGKQGTYVSLTLFWLKTNQEKSIVSNGSTSDDSEGEEWIEGDSSSWTIGDTGLFAEAVTLNFGKNKLLFDIKDKEGKRSSKEIYIEVTDKKELTDAVSNIVIGNIEKKNK